ncbi:MAG: PglZ domain-containing protein, partial [Desulfovermiculus sp.]
CWGAFLDGESGLVGDWTLRDVTKQHHFFSTQVKPLLTSSRSKVFVIISDALRYEVAEELARDINSKSRFKAKLTSQLGVLPKKGVYNAKPNDNRPWPHRPDHWL